MISGEETVSEMNEGINLVIYPRETAGLCDEKKGETSSVAEEFSGV